MNRDDIIRMAREAWGDTDPSVDSATWYQNLERFAALVAAAEREACAQVADGLWKWNASAREVAAAIRARGQG